MALYDGGMLKFTAYRKDQTTIVTQALIDNLDDIDFKLPGWIGVQTDVGFVEFWNLSDLSRFTVEEVDG